MKLPRHAEIWLGYYLRTRMRNALRRHSPSRVWLTVCDHYEPLWHKADRQTGIGRVALWRREWPRLAQEIGPDSLGNLPKYSFFYPQDEYQPIFLDPLAELVQQEIADVEVHIHHDSEGRAAFIDKMSSFCEALHHRHGLLRVIDGKLSFGFIHGNWTLDNSHPQGRWCGLNDELLILKELGCYADFTMPSGANPMQASMVNEIYWATDDPNAPKSYDHGVPVRPGEGRTGDMLMITGPIGFRWRERLIPRMETAEIAGNDPVTQVRVRRFFDLAPRVGTEMFLKLHTHGTQERNSDLLLTRKNLVDLYRGVRSEAQRVGAQVVFASAFEMYLGVLAAAGLQSPRVSATARAEA